MQRKNLVLSVVGDDSVHNTWISEPTARQFDLCLIYYGDQPGRFADEADYYFQRQGIKYSLLHAMAKEELGEILQRYDMIWAPDDDIAADTYQVNRLFQIAKQYRLQIAQPAIGAGDVSYQALRHHPGYLLRYTQFVEMMCPLFSGEALARVLPLFNENVSGWGLDWVWSSLFAGDEVAVVDAVAIDHTRPLASGSVYQRFAALGINSDTEYDALLAKYNLRNRRRRKAIARDTARLRAIAENGQRVWTRPTWLRRAA